MSAEKKCYECGKLAQTKKAHRVGGWSPFFCIECDEKRIARINAGFKKIGEAFDAAEKAGDPVTFFDPARSYTIGETYDPAMKVRTQEEADAFLGDLIAYHIARHGQTAEQARSVILSNIGYYAGYFDGETARRVYPLFKTAHPIFGTATPTAEEAFTAGQKLVTP